MIGGAYIGFAARDGRPSANLIELAGAVRFAGTGLAGLQFNPLVIAGGYVGHGFWDLIHHRHGPYADTAREAEAKGEVQLLGGVQQEVRLLFGYLCGRAHDPLLEAVSAAVRHSLA